MIDRLPPKIRRRITVDKECWLWVGCLQGEGYGQIEIAHRHWLAHRLVWSLLRGPLPEHLHHRPTCLKRCVNPDHLEPLTAAEHARRHALEACRSGHPMTVENTYVRKDGRGRQCRACKASRARTRYSEDPAGATAARTERRRRRRLTGEVDIALTN